MASAGVSVVTFNALAARVTTLESKVKALEARPLPVDYSAQIAALDARLRALEAHSPAPQTSAPQVTFTGQMKVG